MYFNYNTDAFGTFISGASGFEVTYTNPDYICGQFVDAAAANIYGSFVQNDNIMSRVSWSFSQAFSSSTFAADNVTDTATRLAHLKMQYIDVLEEPMVVFEDATGFDDQFFTACGPSGGGPFETADCTNFPGTQLLMDTFDSSGATLSNDDVLAPFGISIYPNPTSDVINIRSTHSIDSVEMFDLLGKQVLIAEKTEQIKVNQLPTGIYILRIHSEKGKLTKKIVIE